MRINTLIFAAILLFAFSLRSECQFLISVNKGVEITKVISIPGIVADPNDPDFSGAEFAEAYPNLRIPADRITLNYPEIRNAIDTLAVLWYLVPIDNQAVGEMNVILIAISPENVKRYYIDNNNDKAFSSYETSFSFRSDELKRYVNIDVLGETYQYTIFNPDYVTPPSASEFFGNNNRVWRSVRKKPVLSLGLSTAFGGGKTSLAFAPVAGTVSYQTYSAVIPGTFRPSVGLDFSWFNFHIGIAGGYEYTQYTTTTLKSLTGDLNKVFYNRGLWPKSKLNATVYAEYDIAAGRYLYISPYGSYTLSDITSDEVFDKAFPPPADASYSGGYSTEFGIKMKLPVSPSSMLSFKIGYSSVYLDASEFLPEYKPETYRMDQHLIYYGVGITFRLTNN
ncbi:MAG TPA: hypothetical protein VLQ76_04765 [Bacteroidales bacterium]|nr:hypothetical protein [Bacteroidales bacterium]